MEFKSAREVILHMESMQDQNQRDNLMRFFKTGAGQYGEGDEFLGIKVPKTREVAKLASGLDLNEIHELLMSPWHEVRMCGFLVLVSRFDKLSKTKYLNDAGAATGRDRIVKFYLDHADRANNWDLVDLSAYMIVGHWLELPSYIDGRGLPSDTSSTRDSKQQVLDSLAQSGNLWRQRIAMQSTMWTAKKGDASWTLRYAEMFLSHRHDLMHKVTGWMLREVGTNCGMSVLRDFLGRYVHEMPRTALRYAIEKMSEEERRKWMEL